MGQFELKKEDKAKLVVLGADGLCPLAYFEAAKMAAETGQTSKFADVTQCSHIEYGEDCKD